MSPSTQRSGVPGARIATLVAGGLIAALALAATTVGGLVALGAADASQRVYALPETITAIEVRSISMQVSVESDVDRVGEPAIAIVRGTGSTAFGSLPGLDIEIVGTTAVITPDETKRQLPPTPYALEIQLSGLALDAIDVEVVERPVTVDASARQIRAISRQGYAQVRVPEPGVLEYLEIESSNTTYVMLPESGGPYRVLVPEWFDEAYIEQWWSNYGGLDYQRDVLRRADPLTGIGPVRGASPIDGPGVFVPTSPDAAVTVDLRGVGSGMLQVVGIEALARLDR